MEPTIIVFVILGLLGLLGAVLYSLQHLWRRRALCRWATANDYKLIDYDQPMFSEASPFPFTVSKAQQVIHVSVQQKDGHTKSGWLLLGDGLLELISGDAEVRWDP